MQNRIPSRTRNTTLEASSNSSKIPLASVRLVRRTHRQTRWTISLISLRNEISSSRSRFLTFCRAPNSNQTTKLSKRTAVSRSRRRHDEGWSKRLRCSLTRAAILAAVLIIASLPVTGCSHTESRSSGPPPSPLLVTPHLWPTYLAINYGKPGQPHLTSGQVKLIRKTLALVKPCQVRFLRYTFPSNASGSGIPL